MPPYSLGNNAIACAMHTAFTVFKDATDLSPTEGPCLEESVSLFKHHR